MEYKKLSSPEKFIIAGIPILFCIGSMMHFIYELSGENILIGALAPINESVWEHLKMMPIPIILWWTFYFYFSGNKSSINKNKWFTGALISLLTSLTTVPLLFYFYTNAFGIESIIIDIVLLFIALLFGQLLGLHFYRYSKGLNFKISILLFVIIIFAFILFTFYTPQLPLFKDSVTGTYGIFRRN